MKQTRRPKEKQKRRLRTKLSKMRPASIRQKAVSDKTTLSSHPGEIYGPPRTDAIPCRNETTITIRVPLSGCVNELVATTSTKGDTKSERIAVHVTALEIENESSARTRCAAIPSKTITVVISSSLAKVNGVDVSFPRQFADVQ